MPNTPLVAVVDDDDSIREALCDLLMVSGLACHSFGDADAFLADYAPGIYDCLITDVRMPGMSGIDMLESLRSRGSGLPTIVLTSVVDPREHERATCLGIHAWLTKPAAGAVLLAQLKSAIASDVWPERPQS
ncbi:response regulator [Sphingopyxis sp. CCNWLW253]|uniref:response regulator transcription factor n=1 Tax=unclassified Sphingopyxis TaxID=2614943 RepID=UPI0030130943